jgi:hypothetical protein
MTASGTFQTCRRTLKMSAYRGRPEVVCARMTHRGHPIRAGGARNVRKSSGLPICSYLFGVQDLFRPLVAYRESQSGLN